MNRKESRRPGQPGSIDRRQAVAGLAAMALGGAVSSVLAQGVRGVTASTIKVGSTLGLTGPVAVAQEHLRAGQYAYMRMLNDRGGVNGRKLEIVFEDNEYSAQKGVLAVRKLVTRDNIFALIGSNGTAQINPVLPFLAQEGVPVINSFTATLDWFNPVNPNIYGVYTPYEYCVQALGRWAAKDGHGKILVTYPDLAFLRELVKYVEPGAKSAAAGATVEFMPIKLGTVDYVPIAREIMRIKPDAVVSANIVAEFVSQVRALRAQGSSIPIYTPPVNVFETLLAMYPAEMEGIKAFAFTTSPYADTPAVREYRDAIAKFVPTEKPDFFSLFSYAGTKVFVEALSRIKGDITLPALHQSLQSMQGYDSGILPPITFSTSNHQGTNSLFKVTAKAGRWTPTGEIVDAAKNAW